jgi:chemotaxis protein CheZ
MHDPSSDRLRRAAATADVLAQRLVEARVADRALVEDVVRSVFATLHGDLTSKETGLLSEVEELGRTIAAAKAEIAALRVDDITVSHIPSATDELDAIVAHTAAATNAILEVCETLDILAGSVEGDAAAKLADATTRIYEACSFQDITGQRINKVVLTLKAIEVKVAQIVDTFSDPIAADAAGAAVGDGETSLLNGPQLPMTAMDQSEIDRLLASFE